MKHRLKVADFSDIHFGHANTPTPEIIESLRAALPDNAETAELDIIFFSGDMYETLLYLNHPHAADIDLWSVEVLALAEKYDIMIRILEGTPGHDRQQPERFVTMHKAIKSKVDLKYQGQLCIEYIEKFDIHVLYVPDKWPPHAQGALNQVKQKMRELGISKVDIAIMHGCFEFQLPEQTESTHNFDEYAALVSSVILIGHHHTHVVRPPVIVPGSMQRLKHGEEEAKGHVRLTIETNGDYECTFVETKNAKIYKTVHCTGLELSDAMYLLDEVASKLPDNSFIRVMAEKGNPVLENIPLYETKYPFLYWSKEIKIPKKSTKVEDSRRSSGWDFVPVHFTKDNIRSILLERVGIDLMQKELLDFAKEEINEAL